jgi:hypothetical protein
LVRWIADVSVIHAFESGLCPKNRFFSLLRELFNLGVLYKGKLLKWDALVEQKAGELARYILRFD